MTPPPSATPVSPLASQVERLRHCLDGLSSARHSQAPHVLKDLVKHPEFTAKVASEIVFPIVACPTASSRARCLSQLLEAPPHRPSANAIVSAIVSTGHYDLVPILVEHDHLPDRIPENEQIGIIDAASRQWSYPDVLCPQALTLQSCLEPLMDALFATRVRSPSARRSTYSHIHLDMEPLEKLLALPLHPQAQLRFRDRLWSMGSRISGSADFKIMFDSPDGKRCALFIQAGLLDPQHVESLFGVARDVRRPILSRAQEWLLGQALPDSKSRTPRPTRF